MSEDKRQIMWVEGFCSNCALNDDCDKEWVSKVGCPHWKEITPSDYHDPEEDGAKH
jgi:hypothetical protein